MPDPGALVVKGIDHLVKVDRDDRAKCFAAERPDKFKPGVGGFNLPGPGPALRGLEAFVGDNPAAYATVGPRFRTDGMSAAVVLDVPGVG